jgi:signal transduction histidine kinase
MGGVMDGGAYLSAARSKPSDEQGLREVAEYARGVHLLHDLGVSSGSERKRTGGRSGNTTKENKDGRSDIVALSPSQNRRHSISSRREEETLSQRIRHDNEASWEELVRCNLRLEQMLRQSEADLQRYREQLVTMREDERRRLRRDLHDGLGSTLAGLTFGLDATRSLLKQNPKHAGTLLAELKAQTQGAITDIRRLVYDLRPPVLDDLGLVGALYEQAANYGLVGDGLSKEQRKTSRTNDLIVSVEAPEYLPPLPGAVEIACYRITQEAMTNVVRHARAHACHVRLSIDEIENMLELEITDDGLGLPEDHCAGVGLNSMRERADELGGTCVVCAVSSTGGTRVLTRLPLPTREE